MESRTLPQRPSSPREGQYHWHPVFRFRGTSLREGPDSGSEGFEVDSVSGGLVAMSVALRGDRHRSMGHTRRRIRVGDREASTGPLQTVMYRSRTPTHQLLSPRRIGPGDTWASGGLDFEIGPREKGVSSDGQKRGSRDVNRVVHHSVRYQRPRGSVSWSGRKVPDLCSKGKPVF